MGKKKRALKRDKHPNQSKKNRNKKNRMKKAKTSKFWEKRKKNCRNRRVLLPCRKKKERCKKEISVCVSVLSGKKKPFREREEKGEKKN